MDFKKVQETLLKNENYAKAYDEQSIPFEIAKMVIQARVRRNITQKQLAQLVNTGQSSIARLESGESLPSLSFLQKVANALDVTLLPPLFIANEEIKYLSDSKTDNQLIKVKMLDIRRSLASNPRKALIESNLSGNAEVILGGSNV